MFDKSCHRFLVVYLIFASETGSELVSIEVLVDKYPEVIAILSVALKLSPQRGLEFRQASILAEGVAIFSKVRRVCR